MPNPIKSRILSCACFLGTLLFGLGVSNARAQDWPQWRGPDRSGICPEKVALAASWPAAGPTRLWVSEHIPGGAPGGYGSPVVAGGRVFVYANVKIAVPVATRKLPENNLRNLGWTPADKLPPGPLLAALEEARLSDERAKATTPKEIGTWVDQWLNDHLTAEQRPSFGAFCTDRLRKGKAAFAVADLTKLTPIKDKLFATQAEFDLWLDQSGITSELRKAAVKAAVATEDVGKDVVYCFDATDGKTIWRREYDKIHGKADVWGASSSTPCIADGRCYVAGADGALYCLSVRDGTELWATKPASGIQNSSPLVLDGVVIVASIPIYAVQAQDGKPVWQQPKAGTKSNSPVVWESAGKKYLLCNGEDKLHCLDAATGDILWEVPGKLYSTAAVAGDVMAVQSSSTPAGLTAYRISPAKAEQLWAVDVTDRGASPIIADGCVYSVAHGRAVCVRVADGTIAWDNKVGGGEISSPVLADGKLFTLVDGGKNFVMLRATPEKFEQLGKAPLGILTCSSPAITNGKLYVRLENGIGCYDLTGPATAPSTAAPR